MSALATRTERYLYEFEEFRVDPVRRRLIRHGEPVPLTPKAFAILLILIEKRGEVVEKEALIQKVWPDTFVTEANLTQNVSALRKALGERAGDSRFVVTVPGRGYSFVADILETPRDATGEFLIGTGSFPLPPAPVAPAPLELTPKPATPTLDDTQAWVARQNTEAVDAPVKRRSRLVGVGLLCLALVAATASYLYFFHERPSGTALPASSGDSGGTLAAAQERPSIAVLGFRNLTARKEDAWLSTAFSEMLATELTGGGARMISGENVSRARQSRQLPDLDSPEGTDLEQLHTLLGADLIVFGSYTSLGGEEGRKVRLDLRVLRLPDGETVTSLAEVGTESELFELVSRTGVRLRRDLGWGDLSPEQTQEVQALRPANPEATRLYAEGLLRLRAYDPRGARDLLERAAAADPASAVIRSALSRALAEMGYDERSAQDAEKAMQLSASLPKEARLSIQARFHEAKKEWAKASEIYRSLSTFFPDDLDYGLRLVSTLSAAGRGPEAKVAVAALRRLPAPAGEDPRIDLAEGLIAKSLADPAVQRRFGQIAEAKGRRLGESQLEAEALLLQGAAVLQMDGPAASVAYFEKAMGLFEKAGNQAAVARTLTHIGVAYHEQGELVKAGKFYEEALATVRRVGSASGTALQLANLGMLRQDLGNLAEAQSLLDQGRASFVQLGDRVFESRAINALGTVLWSRGDVDGARQSFERVLSLSRETGNRSDEARALDYFGTVMAARGTLAEARRLHEQGADMSAELGNLNRAASMSAEAAAVAARLGDVNLAQRRFDDALAAKRKAGDKLGIAQVLSLLADFNLRRGNLAASRSQAQEQLQIGKNTGARLTYTAALQNLGRLDLAAGDVESARSRLEEALNTDLTLGADLDAMTVRLDLARVALAQERHVDAARLAREVINWCSKRFMPGSEAQANSLLAEALLYQGFTAEARDAAGRARSLADKTEDRELQIAVTASSALVDASSGDAKAALVRLGRAVDQAGAAGFVAAGLEARLARGRIQLGTEERRAGREALLAVQKDAEARGFTLLARRAEAALKGGVTATRPLG
jgi:DNA-binding winged helix-turn-helix (wHTH) protein/tetratricopeptide (TPR) repeat protein/TolB-like protein